MQIDYDNIEKYIQGEFTDNELMEFETSLEKDEALQKRVNFYQYAMSALTENKVYTKAEEDKLAQINPILDELSDKYFINKAAKTKIPKEEVKSKPSIIKRLIPYAALAAAAALLIFLFLPQLQNQPNSEIAELNFKPYSLSTNPMGVDETAILFEKGKRNYNNGKFEEANKQFSAFLREIPKAPDVWLAKGCAAYASNDINTALNSFEKVIEIDDSGISHPYAHWYMALCYLKKDDPEKAIHHLKEIKEGADNYKDAKRLIRKLK